MSKIFFLLIFIYSVNNSLTISLVQSISSVSPLNGPCTTDADCGYGAFCNLTRKCACRMGDWALQNGINCIPVQCSNQARCDHILAMDPPVSILVFMEPVAVTCRSA